MQTSQRHYIFLKKQLGMTLLEVMLVLAVGAGLIALSIQQYAQWSEASQIEQLRGNIDGLFQAMAYYYKANCNDSTDGSGNPVANTGALSASSLASTNPYPPTASEPVLVSTLQSSGYLTHWQPFNPLVGSASSYVVQFNPVTSNRQVYACWNFGTTGPTCTVPQVTPTSASAPYPANAVTWRIQVSLLMANTALANVYKAQLAADCTSGPGTVAGTIAPCAAGVAGNYLVWERSPSFVSSNVNFKSTEWQSDPILREFQLQYTNDPMYEFYNINYAGTEYFVCGG